MSDYRHGIQNQHAPEWSVETWFNLPDGKEKLTLADLRGKIIYLYNFQSWCPGCHSHGFPTLKAVQKHFANSSDVAFVAIQTVFEGFSSNTLEHAKEVAQQHQLDIPFGHDPGLNNSGSQLMRDYRSGGTPWTVLIDQKGVVRFNGFHADPNEMIRLIEAATQREPMPLEENP